MYDELVAPEIAVATPDDETRYHCVVLSCCCKPSVSLKLYDPTSVAPSAIDP